MKNLKNLLCALVIATMAFVGSKASAFPLTLTALGGTITSTAHFGVDASSTTNRAITVAVTLKTIMSVVSNQVFLNVGTNIPTDVKITFDPFTFATYLTNSSGFFYDLSGNNIVHARFNDIATTFRPTTTGGVEADTINFTFDARGVAADGLFYEFQTFGKGRLNFSVNDNLHIGSMSIVAGGSEYGEYKNSDDGVASGNVVFRGTGAPEWNGPYSVFWWNN